MEVVPKAPPASSPPFAPSALAGLRGSLRAGRRSLGSAMVKRREAKQTTKTQWNLKT